MSNFFADEAGDQAVEVEVLDLQLDAQLLRERVQQDDVVARRLARSVRYICGLYCRFIPTTSVPGVIRPYGLSATGVADALATATAATTIAATATIADAARTASFLVSLPALLCGPAARSSHPRDSFDALDDRVDAAPPPRRHGPRIRPFGGVASTCSTARKRKSSTNATTT